MFLKILQYSRENASMKFLRTPILKNFCIRLLLNWLYEVIVWNFISGVHLKSSSVILQRCQWLSNQSFKQNLWHVLSIHLTPMLSCEPRFPMFINRHYTKVLGLFGKRCNNVLCVIWLDRNYCRWNLQRQHLNQYIKFIYIENVVVLHREWLVLFVLLLWHFQKLNLTGGFLIFLFMLTGIEIFVCSAGCTSLIVWCWIIKLGAFCLLWIPIVWVLWTIWQIIRRQARFKKLMAEVYPSQVKIS